MLTKKDLHPYQTDILKKAKTTSSLGLFLEPGLGKTTTALSIIAESPKGKTLVVAPKRVAESVWAQEVEKWEHLKHLKVVKVMGTPKHRLNMLRTKSDIFVVNLENLVWLLEQGNNYDYLIIDESSRFKDPSTKRFKAIKKHLKNFKRRVILTGTPTPQGTADLWAQVGILDLGKRLETSITKFRTKYMYAGQRNRHTGVVYKWELNDGASEIIMDKIRDICVSMKAEDYLQLPKLTSLYHKIYVSPEISNIYATLKKTMVLDLEGEQITAPTAATLVGKLLQLTSGAIYNEDGSWVGVHEAKVEFLQELLESASHPTIVFYHFKHSLVRLKEAFPEAQVLSDDNIQDWRDGKIKVMLAHPMSGGIGLNLQCNVGEMAQEVWFDLPWSSENYIQANARVYRQGQTKPVVIHHLMVTDTIDERVIDVLEGKINLQDALMNELKFKTK